MTRRWEIGLTLFLVLLLVMPVNASTITASNINAYSASANPGYVFYKIKIGDLPIGTNQTHTVMYQGHPYLLTINTWTDYGLWKNAEITLTMPNGTVQTSHTSATTVVGSYSTVIQPTVRPDSSTLESGTATFLTVDLNIGLVPVAAQFSTQPMGYNPSASIPFTSASGTFSNGQRTSVYLYQVTKSDFENTIVNYNPAAGLNDLGSAVFQWTWNSVLGFLSMIPVIGPIAVEFITMSQAFLTELWYWVSFVFENLPAIILALETLIIMAAVMNAGKGRRALGKFVGNLQRYNIAVVMGIIGLFVMMRDWILWMVEIVTKIVDGLKPV